MFNILFSYISFSSLVCISSYIQHICFILSMCVCVWVCLFVCLYSIFGNRWLAVRLYWIIDTNSRNQIKVNDILWLFATFPCMSEEMGVYVCLFVRAIIVGHHHHHHQPSIFTERLFLIHSFKMLILIFRKWYLRLSSIPRK